MPGRLRRLRRRYAALARRPARCARVFCLLQEYRKIAPFSMESALLLEKYAAYFVHHLVITGWGASYIHPGGWKERSAAHLMVPFVSRVSEIHTPLF